MGPVQELDNVVTDRGPVLHPGLAIIGAIETLRIQDIVEMLEPFLAHRIAIRSAWRQCTTDDVAGVRPLWMDA